MEKIIRILSKDGGGVMVWGIYIIGTLWAS